MKDLRETNVTNLKAIRAAATARREKGRRDTRMGCLLAILFVGAFWACFFIASNYTARVVLDEPTNYEVAPDVLRVSPGE